MEIARFHLEKNLSRGPNLSPSHGRHLAMTWSRRLYAPVLRRRAYVGEGAESTMRPEWTIFRRKRHTEEARGATRSAEIGAAGGRRLVNPANAIRTCAISDGERLFFQSGGAQFSTESDFLESRGSMWNFATNFWETSPFTDNVRHRRTLLF